MPGQQRKKIKLAEALRQNRRRAQPGSLGVAAVQEVLQTATDHDVRVSLLHLAFQKVVLVFASRVVTEVQSAPPAQPKKLTKVLPCPPDASLSDFSDVDVVEEFGRRVPTLRGFPSFVRGRWRNALTYSLQTLQEARGRRDAEKENLAWK